MPSGMPSVTLWATKGLSMQTNIPKDDLVILNKHITKVCLCKHKS
jgi:hypothetical protein